MKEWERVFRTGDPANDWRQAEAWRHEGWQRGVALQADPLPEGGYRVYAAPGYAQQMQQTGAMQLYVQNVQAGATQQAGAYPNPQALAHVGCHMCQRAVPVKHASITWNVGALVVRFHKTAEGMFCKKCTSELFWKYTAISFFCGWWGVISFVMTIINIPMNIAAYISSRSLPD